MYQSLRMSQSITPKDLFCYLHCQGVPFMFDRVWLLSHAEEERLNQEENNSSTKTDNVFCFSSHFSLSLTI